MSPIPRSAITLAALAFSISSLRVLGDPDANPMPGTAAREQPVRRVHLEEWLKRAPQSQSEVFRIARLGRNRRGGDPWFSPEKSLVFEKGALVALRYFSAFHTGIGDLPEYERRIKEGDPMYIVEYDLRTDLWSLVPLPVGQTTAQQEGADQPATTPEPEGEKKPQPESEERSR